MSPVIRSPLASVVLILGTLICASAQAQEPRSGGGGGGETQRIVQQYQQLAAEKTSLETQVASLKQELDAAHTELQSVKKDRDALKARAGAGASAGARVAELTAARDAAEKNAEQNKQRINELVPRFRDTANELKVVETDRNRLQGEAAERKAAYDQCTTDNLSLYELNGQILDKYEHVGLFTRVSAGEPFTRITRNRNENLVDHYRARALELRTKQATDDTAKPAVTQP